MSRAREAADVHLRQIQERRTELTICQENLKIAEENLHIALATWAEELVCAWTNYEIEAVSKAIKKALEARRLFQEEQDEIKERHT